MRLPQFKIGTILRTLSGILALAALACGGADPLPEPTDETPSVRAGVKIPISTRSDEALDLFLEARTLTDRLHNREARALYLEAIEYDRHFAMALLQLAMTSTSAREFFETMERTMALSEVVSEGERLMILAQNAGIRGDQAEQLEHLNRLVELYPDDERAHFTLAVFHNGRQEYEPAIEHFRRAVEIDPDYSSPYNQLGYIYRALGRYEEAEEAFVKYIDLLPDEPNPYDSYAEMLMKTGRFEESIENYEKALAIKPDFFFSFVGIGHNLIFLGRSDEAREIFERMYEEGPDVANQRNAVLRIAASHIFDGNFDAALEAAGRRYRLAETNDDPAQMGGDLSFMAQIQLAAGDHEGALEKLAGSLQLIDVAGVPDDVAENNARNSLYWTTRIALDRNSLDEARATLEDYRDLVDVRKIPFEQRRVQELEGELALLSGDAAGAITALAEANQQDPRVNYLTALAHRELGDLDRAREQAKLAAHNNSLLVGYAFVRSAALDLLRELDG
jgi:tetratricopeptide (TPR) repeat protein